MQVPQAAKMAAFYKQGLERLLEALSDVQSSQRHVYGRLLQSVVGGDMATLRRDVQRWFAVLKDVVSAVQSSVQSCMRTAIHS